VAFILVVDDDADVVSLVQRELQRQGHEVVTARQGVQALRLMQERRPDLVVLDIVMPGTDGIEVCRQMRRNPATCRVPILFLTKKDTIEDRIEGFEAGGDDYLIKPFNLRELELRARAILRSCLKMPTDSVLAVGPLCLDPTTLEVRVDGTTIALTAVEFELLYFLTRNAGKVISSEKLLQEVWGYPPGNRNTALVRMHVMNVRAKIEDDPRHPQFIQTVTRHGYVVPLLQRSA
jgi:DNA-binding response OmpR family regulator